MGTDLEGLPARKRGRPSLYNAAYCDRVLELAAEGCGKAEIAAALQVNVKTLNAWIKAYDDFQEAMNNAKEVEYAWWLTTGRRGQFRRGWNAINWALQMRNRFGPHFQDRAGPPDKETEGNVNVEELRSELERRLSRIAEARGEGIVSQSVDAGRTKKPQI